MLSLGLLVVRLVVGLLFIGHGAQKLFGWFGGYGPKGTGGWMESVGIKPGVTMAVLAGLMELLGGALLAAGLFTPLAAALITVTMLGAIVKVHGKNGVWSTTNGYEYPLVLIAVAIAVALTGAGSYSLDALLN
ncbi:DoxX family protein [Paenibacillus validus]|uniref:DoxX family membrane protein n=1 Tax=Paenibacillus validus TaxID=44253 RepID=A0A7X2ZD42_9BACL|nr:MULTISPECIES: DoxX family protein [Paenibacillus]MED4599410.1 DoxX family protein [Paenibacillus validus]MED4605122.1 DoxX family protein [Paenibacillus validus]MUG72023.1 DoxX family membrane protein [Paenibacillus validus]